MSVKRRIGIPQRAREAEPLLCTVERKRTPHPLLVHSRRKESPQPSDGLCLAPKQIAEPRITAGNDLEQRFSHRLRAWPLLFVSAYCSQSPLPPSVIF